MKRHLELLIILFLISTTVHGAEVVSGDKAAFRFQHQLGLRLGVWSNLGETPPETSSSQDGTSQFRSKVGDADFFFEGYYGYRLIPRSLIEFSVGIVNRGTVSIQERSRSDVGNLLVYPILVQLKVYPLAPVKSRLQPYFLVGGGLYYGRLSIQFTNNYYGARLSERSATDFNYALSAGVDYPLASVVGLDFNVKYYPINFSKELLGVRDYDGLSITIGVKYLYQPTKTDQRGRSR